MYYTGFADEAAPSIAGQIQATKSLGWSNIEARAVDKVNLHNLPEDKFQATATMLDEAGIKVNCFGSTVANWGWSPFAEEDFRRTTEELERAIVRMKQLDCKMIRGMSFKAQWDRPAFDAEVEAQVFAKMRKLVKLCEDADVLFLHENCNNYGGMSWKHTLKLLEQIDSPNFKLVFDTGNAALNFDRSKGDKLDKLQDSWEFYRNVRPFIHYVHIKDARATDQIESDGKPKFEFTFPGDGQAHVRQIVKDLLQNGYDGGFSIEPHMAVVFHDDTISASDELRMDNYVEYGKRFMKLVEDIKSEIAGEEQAK